VVGLGGLGLIAAVGPRQVQAGDVPRAERVVAPGARQPAATDGGTFTILENGVKVGREEFTIRTVPAPASGYVIEATVVYPTRRIHRLLQTDTSGAPLRYQSEEQLSDRRQQLVAIEVVRGRASERVQTSRGESASEFLVPRGVRLLDVDLFEQYYFIGRDLAPVDAARSGTRSVSILVPPRAAVVGAQVDLVASRETIEVGGQPTPAVHMRVRFNGESADAWTDSGGRVLRIAIPARRLVVVRDEAPR
jgi:hypothetical protein